MNYTINNTKYLTLNSNHYRYGSTVGMKSVMDDNCSYLPRGTQQHEALAYAPGGLVSDQLLHKIVMETGYFVPRHLKLI